MLEKTKDFPVTLETVEGLLDGAKLLSRAGTYDDAIFELKECIDILEQLKLKVQASTEAKVKANTKPLKKPVLPSIK
jgi:hypothetical protein